MAKRRDSSDIAPGTRVACDVNVGDRDIGRMTRRGLIVVCVAKPSEPDEDFLWRAYAAGATVVFSQDADIGNIIDRNNWTDVQWREWH